MLPLVAAALAGACTVLAVAGGLLLRPAPPDWAPGPAAVEGSLLERLLRRTGRAPVRWAGRRLTGYRELASRLLLRAGRPPGDVEELLEVQAGIAVLGVLTALALASLGAVAVGVVTLLVMLALHPVQLYRQARDRQAALDRAMPAFLELMGVLLAAGMTFRLALARIVPRLEGPLAEEMEMLLTQLEFGWTPDEAFAHLVRRSSAPSVQRLVTTARQNLALGVPVAQVLADLADDIRAERVVALKVRAERAAGRATLVVALMALPAAMGLMLAVMLSEVLDVVAQLGIR